MAVMRLEAKAPDQSAEPPLRGVHDFESIMKDPEPMRRTSRSRILARC
jgi:hypothetical protein